MEAATAVGEQPRRPLWQHALLLLVVLGGLATFTGTRSAFVTDESFVVIQLDTIEATGRWTLPHPMPSVDPTGAAFPLHGASRFEGGYTLYGKHPLLVFAYLPVHRALGLAGLIGVSILGTVVAALVAGALAERIRPRSGPLAVWLVGVGSPLFFDAFVIHAHTLAASLAALAVYLAVRAVERPSPRLGVLTVLTVLGTALLRTEGVLFAAALGATVGLVGLSRRRVDLMVAGAGAAMAGAAALVLDRWWSLLVAGSDPVSVQAYAQSSTSYVRDRATSLAITTVLPGYRGSVVEALTFVGAVLVVVGALAVRHRPSDRGALVVPGAGATLLVARVALEWGPIPGLAVAFCVGLAGLALLGGEVWRSPTTRVLLAVASLYGTAVVLTQYKSGGHTEWGGRYFALAVPLLGAVSAASLSQALGRLPRPTRRGLQWCLVVSALALALGAVTTVRGAHDRNRGRSDEVLAAAAELPAAVDGGPPVVVTEDDQVPRLARGRFHEARFLLVLPPHVHDYLGRLARAGVADVLVVSIDPAATLAEVPAAYEPVGPIRPHRLQWVGGGGLIHLRLAT